MDGMKYFRSSLKEYNDNQYDDGVKNMIGGGRVKQFVDAGSNLQSAYAVAPDSESYGAGCMCEEMEGGKKKGGKTAKFLRSVGHFVKPMAPLVKKTKKALAPLAEQALQQGAMELAMSGAGKKGGKTAKFLRSVGHFVKPVAPLVKKVKRALAPLAEQALQQGAMELAMSGAGKKGGKTAKFLRSVGHFVKPVAPLVKKVKRALAPMAQQALNQASMEMAMGAGRKPRMIGGRPPSPWIQHVKQFASEHGISYKEALSKAKATYKK